MNVGKLITTATLALALAGADARAEKKVATAPEKAETTKSAKSAKAKARTARAEKAPAKKSEVPPPPQIDVPGDATPWFEAPLATANEPAAKKVRAEASPRIRYGTDIALGDSRGARRAPAVADDRPDRRRKLTRAEVQSVVREHFAAVRYCHGKATKRGENASQMVLKFEVDDRGRAHSIQVTELSGSKLRRMSRCMSRRMRSWKLPQNTLGGPVEYPLAMERLNAR